MSPLAMAEWIEIFVTRYTLQAPTSPLAMAEWIEIIQKRGIRIGISVSASDGGVD